MAAFTTEKLNRQSANKLQNFKRHFLSINSYNSSMIKQSPLKKILLSLEKTRKETETPKSNASPMNVGPDSYKTRFHALRAEVKEFIKRIILAGGRTLIRNAIEDMPDRPSLIDVTAIFNDLNDDYLLSCKRKLSLSTPSSAGKKKKTAESSSTPSAEILGQGFPSSQRFRGVVLYGIRIPFARPEGFPAVGAHGGGDGGGGDGERGEGWEGFWEGLWEGKDTFLGKLTY